VPVKHLSLHDPGLSINQRGDEVTVTALRPTPWVWLDAGEEPLRVSDNFFSMLPGSYAVSLDSLPSRPLVVRSLIDTVATRPA
jgi:hypothetical protein